MNERLLPRRPRKTSNVRDYLPPRYLGVQRVTTLLALLIVLFHFFQLDLIRASHLYNSSCFGKGSILSPYCKYFRGKSDNDDHPQIPDETKEIMSSSLEEREEKQLVDTEDSLSNRSMFWPTRKIAIKNPKTFMIRGYRDRTYWSRMMEKNGFQRLDGDHRIAKPEFLLINRQIFGENAGKLKNTIINQVGLRNRRDSGTTCIGGGKGKQLLCRQQLADRGGCKLSSLSVHSRQWNIRKNVQECRDFFEFAESENSVGKLWIAKPGCSSRGVGIKIYDSVASIAKTYGRCEQKPFYVDPYCGIIMQEYIQNPVTMQGHKFDLRTYMLIASTDPFIVFYHDGFVRKAQGNFSTSHESISDPMSHITNLVSQSAENHFYNFEQLQNVLVTEHKFDADFIAKSFRPHAMRVSNILFHSARDIKATPGTYQIFALDWIIDQSGEIHLLEANAYPHIQDYPKIGLTPKIFTSMFELERLVHAYPEGFERALSVQERYNYKGWRLVYNQVEAEFTGQKFDFCRYDEYINSNHSLYSYSQA